MIEGSSFSEPRMLYLCKKMQNYPYNFDSYMFLPAYHLQSTSILYKTSFVTKKNWKELLMPNRTANNWTKKKIYLCLWNIIIHHKEMQKLHNSSKKDCKCVICYSYKFMSKNYELQDVSLWPNVLSLDENLEKEKKRIRDLITSTKQSFFDKN